LQVVAIDGVPQVRHDLKPAPVFIIAADVETADLLARFCRVVQRY
jgi:hypothetical protein